MHTEVERVPTLESGGGPAACSKSQCRTTIGKRAAAKVSPGSNAMSLMIRTLGAVLLLSLAANAWAQDEPEGGEPPRTCEPWTSYTLPEGTLGPIITEGVFALPAARYPSCATGDDEPVSITVEDDDGQIPGRVVIYTTSTLNAVVWAPTSADSRVPTAAKNARATVRFVTEYDTSQDNPVSAFEEGTFVLDISTEPTPDPSPPVLVSQDARLGVNQLWGDGSAPCRRPRIAVTWETGPQPPGTESVSAVDIIGGSPDGEDNGQPIGTRGAAYRSFRAYAARYCMTMGTIRPLVDDRTAAADEICYDHAIFEGLLEPGEQLCFPPSGDGPDAAVPDPSAPAGGDGDDDDSGCESAVVPGAPTGTLLFAFAWVLVTLRRRR